MERDEVYIPKTRKDLGIPDKPNHQIDWDEIFGDTPIYTLFLLIRQQLLAFPAYLRGYQTYLLEASNSDARQTVFNVSGRKDYPKWTNHFDRKELLALGAVRITTETDCKCSQLDSFHKSSTRRGHLVQHRYWRHGLGNYLRVFSVWNRKRYQVLRLPMA